MSKRIKEDNDNALDFAKILSEFEFVDINLSLVQTNIFRFKLKNVSCNGLSMNQVYDHTVWHFISDSKLLFSADFSAKVH